MLIDDDKDDQEIFLIAVNKISNKIECIFADGCDEALLALNGSEQMPDIIFLDLNMPKTNGKVCLSSIKTIARAKHIPVVIYSTSADPKDFLETKALGAESFLTKPSDIDALAKSLSGIFDAYLQNNIQNTLLNSNKNFA